MNPRDTNDGRFDSLIVLAAVLTSIAAFAVMVRAIIRFSLIRTPGWDDHTMLLAMVFTFGYLAQLIVSGENGLGSPAITLTMNQMLSFLKTVLAIEITYYLIVGSIKISILFTYLRFALSKRFRYSCWGTIIFEVIFTIICVVLMAVQCTPIEKMWDFTGTVPGTCLNTTAIFYSTSAINIITDIWILILPMKTLVSINRSMREKVALLIIFGAGALATTMSIVRLYSIHIYTLSTDPFRDAIAVNQWSMIEINVAILCASVPALKPLITPKRLQNAINERRYGYQHHYYANDSSGARRGMHDASPNHPHRRGGGANDISIVSSSSRLGKDEYSPTGIAPSSSKARHHSIAIDEDTETLHMVRLPELSVPRSERNVWAESDEYAERGFSSPDLDLPRQGTFHAI